MVAIALFPRHGAPFAEMVRAIQSSDMPFINLTRVVGRKRKSRLDITSLHPPVKQEIRFLRLFISTPIVKLQM